MSSSLTVCNSSEPFLNSILTYDEKWILHDNQWQPAQWLDREKAPKHFPKPNLHWKKVLVTVCWSVTGLIDNFLNPSETIPSEKYAQRIGKMSRKLPYLQSAWVNKKGPVLCNNVCPHTAQPTLQKLNEWDYEISPRLPCSPDLLATTYHFFKRFKKFLQGKHFHNQQKAENAFQEFVESRSTNFYTTGINLFLIGKNVLIAIVPILINKDVLEPNYNDFNIHSLKPQLLLHQSLFLLPVKDLHTE